MLIADAERNRHGNDPAEHRRPERVDELLVVAEEQDELVPALRPELLQVIQNAERALMQLAERHAALFVLTLEIHDAAGRVTVALHELRQGLCRSHRRRSSFMNRGFLVRRLICASSSIGLSAT